MKNITDILTAAIQEGVPLYNNGDVKGCYDVYAEAAQKAVPDASPKVAASLENAIQKAEKSQDSKEGAWILRRCFDGILQESTTAEDGDTESPTDLIKRAIKEGAPLYNANDHEGCYDIYMEAAQYICSYQRLNASAIGQLLQQAIDEATPLAKSKSHDEAAWVLRHCFDDILQLHRKPRMSFRGAMLRADNTKAVGGGGMTDDDDDAASSSDGAFWQDEAVTNTSDFEIGSYLANVAYILRASVQPKTHKRFTGKAFEDSFQGSEAVEVLTGLGLAPNRKMAQSHCDKLRAGSFLIPMSHEKEEKFHDGTHLYRFPDRQELKAALENLQGSSPHPEGSLKAQLVVALETSLELPSEDDDASTTENEKPANNTFSGVTSNHLQPRRLSTMSPAQVKGFALAAGCAKAENSLDIQDRTYRLKKYEKCFIGSDAILKLVQSNIAESKEEAFQLLKDLNDAGLIHHVLYDHGFEDKHYFYRFTSPGDLRKALEAFAILPNGGSSTSGQQELIRHSALINRYKQFADLDVASILNSFFGCSSQEGWDLVDLQNWRDNMKRWGFGRREDQDDEMVDKLSPLALNVDPETWYDSLSEEDREKWESPWGILAQIAIFDQVPRSAFRGTPDAFKYDFLAIKASKVAIERGYFETAYKSTLNQFLVLLPLEHSESWEDQKLGVTLLLQLLSTVAVQDEGLSDYEIVKRLEFSKRLTTAFLEHAQVIAKFKRYPHRNAPLHRGTSLEERVWLASDLVPRWAKSQNPENAKSALVKLPVIPLKKLTRK